MPVWLDSPDALKRHVAAWAAAGIDRIGLDTEFVRERTYWPQLALVQIAAGNDILLVDPLVPGMTEALRPMLADPGLLKVMHSASEDLVAFKQACGVLPAPLFDTQIAAALAGVGGGLGYQKLVQAITGVVLAKGETRSDWMRRPLSASQLEYAADDVLHLDAVYRALESKLIALGRLDWLRADCARLVAGVASDEPERWPHLSLRSAQFLDATEQRILLRLLRWRDVQARASDKPRSWILDNELAVELARKPPADETALQAWLDVRPKSPRKLAARLWQALSTPLPDEADAPVARATDDAEKKKLKRLQDAVGQRSGELGLPDGILASRRWLEALIEAHANGGWPEALDGWRREQLQPLLAPLL